MDISKFSWPELFSNSTGKTSASAFCGVIICLVGTLCFFLGCIDKMWISNSIDIITQSITFVLIGASLLGIRKIASSKTDNIDMTSTSNNGQSELPNQYNYSDDNSGGSNSDCNGGGSNSDCNDEYLKS